MKTIIALATLALIALVFWLLAPGAFFAGWLVAWLFWSGLSFGALLILMLQWLTGGRWGAALRRPCEAAAGMAPWVALLFLPLLLGLGNLYPWTKAGYFAAHPEWVHKAVYLTTPFFSIRAIASLGVFMGLAWLLRRPGPRIRALSCWGLAAYFLVMIPASTDWVMSLTPEWRSSIFPVIMLADQFLSALAMSTLVVCLNPASRAERTALLDLGNLLLAFTIFWMYVTFSQFLLIWMGNLPEEITWYLPRRGGGWQYLAMFLAVSQFALPFALLLSRERKQRERSLAFIIGIMLTSSALYNWWLVGPSLSRHLLPFHPLGPLLFVAMGAVWLVILMDQIKREEARNV